MLTFCKYKGILHGAQGKSKRGREIYLRGREVLVSLDFRYNKRRKGALILALADSTFMLPPAAQLTAQQQALQTRLLQFIQAHQHDETTAVFVLHGDAGSGKSAVLNAVFTTVQHQAHQPDSSLAGLHNRLIVNHNEMLKIYWAVAAADPVLHKSDFQKPTPFINAATKQHRRYDVVFVDEAQLLLSQKDAFNHFDQANQLDALLPLAHVVVLVVDFNQVVKLKSLWTPAMLKQHLAGHQVESAELTHQLRMQDPTVSAWVNAFVAGRLLPLPKPADYELKVFADGAPLVAWVRAKEAEYGLARLIATTDFPFRVFGTRTWYVQAGSVRLPWDKINFTYRPWASRPETLGEVGSIYTIQGFDLNAAGVILGPSLDYDEATDRLTVDPGRFEDQTAFRRRPDLADDEAAKAAIIRHVANILLKRGRRALGIYAVNPRLRARLLALAQ